MDPSSNSSRKNKKLILAIEIFCAIALIAILSWLIAMSLKKTSLNIFNNQTFNNSSLSPEVKLKTEYENPFDEKSNYQNPFEEEKYKNPFDI